VVRIQIEGFGPLVRRAIGPFGPRVNVVVGPNEAGKSALRAFIRTVLMGFPRANSRDDRAYGFSATGGTAYGGSIEFVDAQGRTMVVERKRKPRGPSAGTVRVVRDGDVGDAQALAAALPHLGSQVYDNVFSLSLDELQRLDEDVQKRIYSAAYGSTGAVIGDVRERIDGERRELQRSMDEARRSLAELVRQYAQARVELTRYGEIAADAESAEHEVAALRHEVAGLRGQLSHLELLRAARPAFDQMNLIQREMAGLPRRSYVAFPARLRTEYQSCLETRNDLQRELTRGDQFEELRTARIEALRLQLTPLAREADAERLLDRKSEYQNAVRDREGVMGQLEKGRDALARALEELGPGFDEAKLAKLDTSIASKGRMERLDRALAETGQAERDAAGRYGEAVSRLAEARQTLAAAEAKQAGIGAPVEGTVDELRTRRANVQRLLTLDLRAGQLQRDLEDAQLRLRALRSASTVWARRIAYGQLALTSLISVVGILVIILANQAGDNSVVQTGIAVAGIGVAGFALAGGLILATRAGRRREEDAGAVIDLAATLRSTVEALQSEVAQVEDEVLKLASGLGYERPPAEWELSGEADRLATEAERRADYDKYVEQTEQARLRLHQAEAAAKEAETVAASATAEADEARQRWREWLGTMGLAGDIGPRGALAILSQADACRERLRTLHDLSARVDQMSRAIASVEDGIREIAPGFQLAGFPPEQASAVLTKLGATLAAAREARSDTARLAADTEAWRQRRRQIEGEIATIGAQVARLVREAGVSDEDDLARTIEGAAKHRELSEKLLALRIGSPGLSSPRARDIEAELRSKGPEAVEAELAEVEGEIRAREDRQARLNARLGELAGQQAALQAGSRTAEMASAIAARRSEALELRDRLAVRLLALRLIDDTVEEFRRDHQPDQLRIASGYFARVTGGSYTRLQASIEGGSREGSFEGVTVGGVARAVSTMSRGTKEQLYLSLRFALMDEFVTRQEPLPVIMDDVLVNFDPERARAACEAIRDLSQRHQVLFLTCHPQTVGYFTDMARQSGEGWLKVVELASLQQQMPLPNAVSS
jgi:uncharacterized protein YhaN